MEKEILDMNVEELRIEVAMLRERCAQLEIRLAKADECPKWPPYTPPQEAPVVPLPYTIPPIVTCENTGTGQAQTLKPFTTSTTAEGDSNAG